MGKPEILNTKRILWAYKKTARRIIFGKGKKKSQEILCENEWNYNKREKRTEKFNTRESEKVSKDSTENKRTGRNKWKNDGGNWIFK